MAASFWLKSCGDHSLLKSNYNGGLWKNNNRSEVIYPAAVSIASALNLLYDVIYARSKNVNKKICKQKDGKKGKSAAAVTRKLVKYQRKHALV